MNTLAGQTCESCATAAAPLPPERASGLLAELGGGWAIADGRRLEKEYAFNDFRQALAFTNRVGEAAEQAGHHPDIHLAWGKVRLVIFTHKIGGLTQADFVLAARCDQVLPRAN